MASHPSSQDKYPKDWTGGDHVKAILLANKDSVRLPAGSPGQIQAAEALKGLIYDAYPMLQHELPEVRAAWAELLINYTHDSMRVAAGDGPLAGAFTASLRRGTGAVFDTISPISRGAIADDVEMARSAAEYLNTNFQPLTKGFWFGREEYKTDVTTTHSYGMLEGDAWYMDEVAAKALFTYDREEMRFQSEIALGQLEEKDGVTFVNTSRGKFEIPMNITMPDGTVVDLRERGASVLRAQRGIDPRGPGDIIGDRGFYGSLFYNLSDATKEGWDRNIDVGNGQTWAFVPNMTDDFEFDRENLMNPMYRRALDEASQGAGFWSRASINAGAMAQELAEYVTAAKLLGTAGKATKALLGRSKGALDQFKNSKSLFKDKIVQPISTGAGAATAAGRAGMKSGVSQWMTWGWRDAGNEVVLALGQSMAEGGTMNEGFLKAFNEIAIERMFASAGRVPVWLAGRTIGRGLGERMAFFRNARVSRGGELQEAQRRYKGRTSSSRAKIQKEMTDIYRDKAMADWGIALYDTGFMAMGLASQQVAMEQASRAGVDWNNLSLDAKARRILGAINDSWPEALGNWSAMMGGAMPAMAKQFGNIKGLWELSTPEGQRLATSHHIIQEMQKNDFLQSDVEGIKDLLTMNGKDLKPEDASATLDREHSMPGDLLEVVDDQARLRVQKKLIEHLMAVKGMGFVEAADVAHTEMEETGALTNPGRLHSLETGENGADARLKKARAAGIQIVPLTPNGHTLTYVDPVTGESHTAASIYDKNVELPKTFREVAEESGWSPALIDRLVVGLRGGDPEASRLFEMARSALTEGLEPIDDFDYAPPTGVGTRALDEKGEAQLMDDALAETGVPARVAKSGKFKEPFDAARSGAPEDVVIPEMANSMAEAHGVGLDEPTESLNGLTPRQVATNVYRRLTPEEVATGRTERMIQRVDARVHADQSREMDTTDVHVTELTAQAAGLRHQALALIRQLPGLEKLDSTGPKADGLLSGLVNRNLPLRKLFQDSFGQRGLEAWETASGLAADSVAKSQEVTLHMASRWPAMHARLKMMYRASESLAKNGMLSPWLLRRLRRMDLLVESQDGYSLKPSSVEGMVGEIQLWARVYQESKEAGDLDQLMGSHDIARAVTGWAYGEKPIPTDLLERVMDLVPGSRGQEFMSTWERLVTKLHPNNWPDSLTRWMPWRDDVLRVTNPWGRAYGVGRTAEAKETGEAAVRIAEISSANMLEVRDEMTTITVLMHEYLNLPGVTRDHGRLLVMMVHKGIFLKVRSRADFVKRYASMVGQNAGALYEIGQRYVTLTDAQGQRLVDMGMLKDVQFQKWRGRYVHRPILEQDSFLYSQQERLGSDDNWQQNDQLLSRSASEPNVMRLMDFTLIAPIGVMKEAATVRWVETIYNMFYSKQRVFRRRSELSDAALARDFEHFVDHGDLPQDWPFRKSYVSMGIFDLLDQMRRNLEPVVDENGYKVPDGEEMQAEKKRRHMSPTAWLGTGSSDPASAWFENSPQEVLRGPDGKPDPDRVESHGKSYPRTKKFTDFLDAILEHEVAPDGSIVPVWFVDTNTMELIHQMLNDAFRETTTWQRSVQETITVFRRMKTMYSPKHWIKNFSSSLILNWTAGGVSPADFVRGMLFKSGDYHEANRLLGVWKDSHNPELLARYGHDRKAMVKDWTPQQRFDLLKIEAFLALSGGTTLTGSVLDPLTIENLVDSMIQGEVTMRDLLPDEAHSSKEFELLNRQLQRFTEERSLGAKAQAALFNAESRKEIAKALHLLVSEYAGVEHMFKLAQALHLQRKRNLTWDEAIRRGARGTADYAGVSQIVNDKTSNWRGMWSVAEAPGFEDAKKRVDKTIPAAIGEQAGNFMRFYFADVFWMFNAGALPTQLWGLATHPLRAMAATAFASMAAYGIMKALQSDNDEERVREALLEMYGMEQWSLFSEEELNGILDELDKLTGGLSVSFSGGEYRDNVVEVFRRLLSTQPFRGVSMPRAGRSRVVSTGDIAPLAVTMGLAHGNKLASLLKGHYPEGAERKAFAQGFLPSAIKGTIGWFYDIVKNHRGETPMEHGVRAVLSLSRQFGAAMHPITALGSSEMIGIYEAVNGQSIYDMTKGIRTPEWEEMSLGARLMDVAVSEGFVTRTVHSFAKDVDERDFLAVQRMIENLMPDLKSNVQGTAQEKLLSRAMRLTMEQMVKFARDAYYDHYHLNTALDLGKAVTFDQVLWRRFGITQDMVFTGVEATMGPAATTDMGRFVTAAYGESAEFGWMVQSAATRMVRDYIFGNKRYYPLLELARARLVDPSVFERLFKGLIDGSNADTLKYLYANVVLKDPGKNLRAYYAVYKTVDIAAARGILGKRHARELHEAFIAAGMLSDMWAPPTMQQLHQGLGAKHYDMRASWTIRALERR